MSLRLILMRHAKSSWDTPGPDHARPLNKRGREASGKVGEWLTNHGYLPDQILSSNATRTAETFERMGLSGSPDYTRHLYLADASTMLAVLRQAHGATVLLIGHNPGIADFANRLLRTPPVHPRFFDYPTAATTVMDFDGDAWEDLTFGTGHLVHFIIPRELD